MRRVTDVNVCMLTIDDATVVSDYDAGVILPIRVALVSLSVVLFFLLLFKQPTRFGYNLLLFQFFFLFSLSLTQSLSLNSYFLPTYHQPVPSKRVSSS